MLNDTKSCLLIVADDLVVQQQLVSILQTTTEQLLTVDSAEEAIRRSRSADIDLVICDQKLFYSSGSALLDAARRQTPATDIILICGRDSYESIVDALHRGAADCLVLPLNPVEVTTKIRQVLEHRRLRRELTTLRSHVAMNFGFDNIVGVSKSITQAKETAARIAPTDISVLITGPSGSGKELFARTLHHHSERRRNRFVAIDCSAIAESRIESELFGQPPKPAAPTISPCRSLCEEADGGTLFLGEITELSSAAQARLLRFLQDGLIRPVGDTEPCKVDVRVIAATSSSISSLVSEGKFREDLYYKLAVILLTLPSLSDRADDIELLTGYFLRRLSHELSKPELAITRAAVDKLLSHRWPGNVRELENTLRRAAALCSDNQIDTADITFVASDAAVSSEDESREGSRSLTLSGGLLVHHQREVIVRALDDNRWNFTRTATALGIGRTTLWRKIKKYNLVPAGSLPEED
jgi:DNA-binding NtrC family response regulator